MANDRLLTQVTKFAFLVRLASLLLIFFADGGLDLSFIGSIVVLFVVATSAFGLYRNTSMVQRVSVHPFLVSIDVLIAGLIMLVVGAASPILLYTLSTALLIGLLLSKRVAVPLLTTLIAAYLLAAQVSELHLDVATGLVLPMMYVVLGALGLLVRSLFDTTALEQARNRQLVVEAAGANERARLARDMHDSVGKSLHGIGLAASALPAWITKDPRVAADKAGELARAAETAAAETRSVLVDLRAEEDDRPLTELLRQTVERYEQSSGASVSFAMTGIADCDLMIRREIAAIVGEALENLTRHSGASEASVECRGSEDKIAVSIRDNGRGFETTRQRRGHYGVTGMAERAAILGGTLEIQSGTGQGTTVLVSVPRQVQENSS